MHLPGILCSPPTRNRFVFLVFFAHFIFAFRFFQVAACGELSSHVPDLGSSVLGGDAGRLAGKCRIPNEETFEWCKGLLHQAQALPSARERVWAAILLAEREGRGGLGVVLWCFFLGDFVRGM